MYDNRSINNSDSVGMVQLKSNNPGEPPFGRFCILVVDDEVQNIDVLRQILCPMYNVKTAKKGYSAIEIAKKYVPDLILLDIIMPDISGFDVLINLKNSDITKNIPVIIITGLETNQGEEKGLLLGAVDYITKPFNNSIVKLRVRTHLKIIEQMRTIERLGMMDTLTGIPNRRSFEHQLNVEWGCAIRENKPVGILMIDIDKFKDFNDNYGHAHGDLVLKAVAGIIRQSLRHMEDFAARWGGEEFFVLLPNADFKEALEVAEQIRLNVERMDIFCMDGTNTKVTVSIGVNSEIPSINSMPDRFISKTDKALYSAKKAGRNIVRSN